MKPLILLVTILLLGCAAPQSMNTGQVWKTARSQTVLIEDGQGDHGTGVVINEACALTAGHVVSAAKTALVTTFSGKTYPTVRVAYDENKDVAVVCSASNLDAPSVTIGPLPAIDDTVFTIGFPMGMKWFLTQGQWEENDMTSVSCAPGNSGGGVFDTAGYYVGFVDAVVILNDPPVVQILPHLCYVKDVSMIVKFLDANHITYAGHI